MEQLASLLNIAPDQLQSLLLLAFFLLAGLFALRTLAKLTKKLMQLGCLAIFGITAFYLLSFYLG